MPPISLVSISLIVGMVSFSPWKFMPFSVSGQAALLIVLVAFFCYWPAMARLFRAMPIPHRVLFVLLPFSMLLGHYTLNKRTYFPYVAWEIFPFVHEADPVYCPQFFGVTAHGEKVRLLAEQLFPSIVQTELPDDGTATGGPALGELALAEASMYNRLHPGDPVRTVDIVRVAVKLHPSAAEIGKPPPCQSLQHFELLSAH